MNNFSIPLADIVNDIFDSILPFITPITNVMSDALDAMLGGFENILLFLPPWIMILAIGLLVTFLINKKLGVFTFIALAFLLGLDLWSETMSTLALVLSGTIISLLIGIPVGIASSQSDSLERVVRPILDFMQTLPSFVYLIPSVMLFGLGKVASLVAILIFSMPPAVRLTNLGIRQVPEDMVEAAKAFGSKRSQVLTGVQLPLALPTIMTGVNQCIMMALSMSVIAAMIGGGGLGRNILRAMQTVDIGLGVESGIAIVLLAILLDRATESLSKQEK